MVALKFYAGWGEGIWRSNMNTKQTLHLKSEFPFLLIFKYL